MHHGDTAGVLKKFKGIGELPAASHGMKCPPSL